MIGEIVKYCSLLISFVWTNILDQPWKSVLQQVLRCKQKGLCSNVLSVPSLSVPLQEFPRNSTRASPNISPSHGFLKNIQSLQVNSSLDQKQQSFHQLQWGVNFPFWVKINFTVCNSMSLYWIYQDLSSFSTTLAPSQSISPNHFRGKFFLGFSAMYKTSMVRKSELNDW